MIYSTVFLIGVVGITALYLQYIVLTDTYIHIMLATQHHQWPNTIKDTDMHNHTPGSGSKDDNSMGGYPT